MTNRATAAAVHRQLDGCRAEAQARDGGELVDHGNPLLNVHAAEPAPREGVRP